MSNSIGIIGSGAFGTAIAKVLAEKGHSVELWSRTADTAEEINSLHTNERYLKGVALPASILSYTDIQKVANNKDFLILAVPSLYLLETVKKILTVPSIMEGQTTIGVLTKGFLNGSKGPKLILETLENYLPGFYSKSLVYIAGPSHAEEVATGKVTGLIAASESPKNSIRFRELLTTARLLVFSSFDVTGVQVCAAVKNVIAIGFGMLDALKAGSDAFGDDTESLLLAAGLNEIMTLGMALGATHPETFTSISGVGDLDVTCRSIYGRNRRFGKEIIEKDMLKNFSSIDDLIERIDEIGYLPEGIAACKFVKTLAEQHRLKMPISLGIYKILNKEAKAFNFAQGFIDTIMQKGSQN